MKKKDVVIISGLAVIIVTFIIITLSIAVKDARETPKDIVKENTIRNQYDDIDTTELGEVTIDGFDNDKNIIPILNVWENYKTRTFAFRLYHGDKVWMLERVGDGVKIMTKDKRVGWITYWFIKELKSK